MKKYLTVLLLFSLLSFSGCFLRRPIKVEKEYYESGNIKLKHWYYKNGVRERVRYYSDHKTRTKTKKGKIEYKQKQQK